MPSVQLPTIAEEESTFKITMDFLDFNGADLILESANWTLTKTDGTIVNGRTAVDIPTPAATETVTLSGNDLAILDGEALEERVFLLEGLYNSGTETLKKSAGFKIRNLVAV